MATNLEILSHYIRSEMGYGGDLDPDAGVQPAQLADRLPETMRRAPELPRHLLRTHRRILDRLDEVPA